MLFRSPLGTFHARFDAACCDRRHRPRLCGSRIRSGFAEYQEHEGSAWRGGIYAKLRLPFSPGDTPPANSSCRSEAVFSKAGSGSIRGTGGLNVLVSHGVADRQAMTSLGATAGQDLAAVLGFHAGAKAVLVDSLAVARVEGTFHGKNPVLRGGEFTSSKP